MNVQWVQDVELRVGEGAVWATGPSGDLLVQRGETRVLEGLWLVGPLATGGPCHYRTAPLVHETGPRTRHNLATVVAWPWKRRAPA